MAQERLQLIISADNREANSAFNQTNAQIGSMEQLAARVANSISRHFQQMATEIQRAIQNLSGVFNGLDRQALQARQLVDQYGRPVSSPTSQTPVAAASYAAPAAMAAAAASAQRATIQSAWNEQDFQRGAAKLETVAKMSAEEIRKTYKHLPSEAADSAIAFQQEMRHSMRNLEGYRQATVNGDTHSASAFLKASDENVRNMAQHAQRVADMQAGYDKAAEAAKKLSTATKDAGDSMTGSMVKAMVLYQALESGLTTIKTLTVESTKYAAETRMYGVAMHAVAQANGIVGESLDSLETKLKSLGIGTQEARRGLIMMAAAGMDLSKAPQLARLGQDLAVMKPDMTSSQVFNNLLYGIQSGQIDVLRTIGLNVSFESGYKDYARSVKRTVESLSEEEKMRSRVNTVIKEASKYAGMYEKAQDEVGKKLKSMERFADDAKNAIGEQFIPAMKLVVATATWALQEISKNPMVAKAVGVLGATAGGAVIGAGVGGVVGGVAGAFFGGAGAVPGAILGAKIGAGVGTLVGVGSATASEVGANQKKAEEAYKWNQYNHMTGAQRRDAVFGYIRTLGNRPESTPPPTTDDKHAKAVNSALEQAREALAHSQAQALEGVDKILAEHDEIIRKLKQEGVLTAQIAGLYEQVKTNNLLHFGKELSKQESDAKKEWDRLVGTAEKYMVNGKEMTRMVGGEVQKQEQARMEENLKLLEDYSQRSVDAIQEVHRQSDQYQFASLQRQQDVLKKQEEIELTQLDQTNAHTLASKLGLEQQKLQVRLDYINRERDAELKLLAFKGEIAKKEVAIRYAGQDEMIRKLQSLIDLQTKLASDAATSDANDKAKLARESAIKNQYNLVYEANKKLYDQLKQSAEGVFDAMLTKSQSVWGAMANAFKMAFLTVLKEIVSSQIARSLTGLLTGQHVGLTPGGSQAGTGVMGRFGGLLGLAGVGAVPVFGGSTVSYSQSGQGGGVAGTVNSLTGGNGISSVQKLTGIGGASAQTWSQLAGLEWQSATVGGKTIYYNAVNGITLSPAQYAQMKFFGKFGKAGGAIQSAMMAGGLMMGADAMMRGGALGVGEAAMGGAMIGTSVMPGIGTLVGAGIGALAGVARMIIGGQTPEQKMKERVRTLTGVDVQQKNVLRQMVEMARSQFAGNYDLFIRSKNGQDFIEMYAQQTGQKFRSAFNARSFSMLQSGGSLYELPTFSNGSALNPMSNLPGMGFSMALDQIQSGGVQSGPMSFNIRLDGPAATSLMRGEAVQVIVDNPRLVQSSSLSATKASANRRQTTAALLSPGTQFA